MNRRCSTAVLKAALAGSLPKDDEAALNEHLSECDACGDALEQMAGGDAWCQEAASWLVEDELDKTLSAGEDWSAVDFTVDHLEPADEPHVLGRLGGYDVMEIIGHGGMGVVLKAFDRDLKRCVAIKVLAPHLARSSLARKRFAREAQAAAAVVHPNVLAIHQVQPTGRLPFLVMPLVAGESLAQRLNDQGTLELKEILRIGMQAAAGLAAAHEQGLVHRDVKPANILLEKGVERAVLTDFGLARAADDVALTRWGVIAGTPEYMSPEQARGEALDGRSDLFSLGCALYEMATGVSPFRADSVMATMRRLVDDSPQAIESLNSELPRWFNAVVERLLEKDPARRFTSAKEVSELLEGCLAHVQQPATVPLPANLPQPPARRRWWPLGRRFKTALALLGAGIVAAVLLATLPPDITGRWWGDEWGEVVLTKSDDGVYTGTYSETAGTQPGEIRLEWSRIERRYNGTWREADDRFGELSVRLLDTEIRGALTNAGSRINAGAPRLADLKWVRREELGSGAQGASKATDAADAADRQKWSYPSAIIGDWHVESFTEQRKPAEFLEFGGETLSDLNIQRSKWVFKSSKDEAAFVVADASQAASGRIDLKWLGRITRLRFKRLDDRLIIVFPTGADAPTDFKPAPDRILIVLRRVAGDLDRLQGQWRAASASLEREDGTVETVRGEWTLRFDHDELWQRLQDLPLRFDRDEPWRRVYDHLKQRAERTAQADQRKGEERLFGLVELDQHADPKTIDIVRTSDGDKRVRGIYSLSEDGLRVALARGADKPRPLSFLPAPNVIYYKYERVPSGSATKPIVGQALQPDRREAGKSDLHISPSSGAGGSSTIAVTQVCLSGPSGMQVSIGGAEKDLGAPARYYIQRQIHETRQLALFVQFAPRSAVFVAGRLDIYPGDPMTAAFLENNAVPFSVSEHDTREAWDGKTVTKVVFLQPSSRQTPRDQDLSEKSPPSQIETLDSTELEPGTDPILAAARRGTILAVLRLARDFEPLGIATPNAASPVSVSRTFPLRFKLASEMAEDLRQILPDGGGAKPSADNQEIMLVAPREVMRRVQTFITVMDWPDGIMRKSNYEYPRDTVLRAARSFFYACAIEDSHEVFSKLLSPGVLAQLKGDTKSEHYFDYNTGGTPDLEWEKSLRADWPGKKEAIERLVREWNRYPLKRITEQDEVAIGFGVKYFCSLSFDGAPEDFYRVTIEPERIARDTSDGEFYLPERDVKQDSFYFASLPPWWNLHVEQGDPPAPPKGNKSSAAGDAGSMTLPAGPAPVLPPRAASEGSKSALPSPATAVDAWPVFRGDPASTGVANTALAAKPALIWKKSFKDDRFVATAAIVGGVVFVGALDGNLKALELATGDVKWGIGNQSVFKAAPAVRNGVVYIGDVDDALDLATGEKTWEYEAGGSFLASPAVAQGRLVIGNDAGDLYCFGSKP